MKYLLPIVLSLILFSCSDSEEKEDTPTVDYDRKALLENTYREIIFPALTNATVASQHFNDVVTSTTYPLSSTDLTALQAEWKKAKIAWESCELFDLGYVKGNYLKINIDYWPANTDLLNKKIADTSNTINAIFIQNTSPASRGFQAISYLLFEENALTDLNNDSIRWKYVTLATTDIHQQINTFKAIWMDYEPSFIAASGTGVNASLNLLVNKCINELETIVNMELGEPLGIQNSGALNPNTVETPYARYSSECIYTSLQSIEKCYFGATATSSSMSSMASYLDNSDLNSRVKTQFEACYSALNKLDKSIYELAEANQKDSIELCYTEIRKLLILFKVDVVSTLSISLTVSDNDGD